MYRSILIPLDGSAISEWALPAALSIARRQDARIDLITIDRMMPPPDVDEPAFGDKTEAWRSAEEDAPLAYLSGVARRIREITSTPVTFQVLSAPESVAHQVVQYARDSDNDLIVMTTHGRGGFTRFWLGSVADEVVRRSQLPTLLVKSVGALTTDFQVQPQYRSVLIPLDGSVPSRTVVDHALGIAGPDAQYTFLQAVPVISAFTPEYAQVANQVDGEVRRAQQEGVQALLDEVADGVRQRGPGIKVRTAVVTGNAVASEILAYANHQSIDLIAMTTHGRGKAMRLMLGSVADKVMRGAAVPVLLYRPA